MQCFVEYSLRSPASFVAPCQSPLAFFFFFFNNQRRVLFLLFERLGKPCQSSCRQLGELGYTGTTFNVEEKGKASWEQAGSAGLMCLTSQPVKCHRENLASEHGSAGGLQRREHPLKAHSPSPAQAGSRCICAREGPPLTQHGSSRWP